MIAIRIHEFGGPDVLKPEDIPTSKPGPGEVLVQVKAAGVNPFETYIRAGTYPVRPELPATLGTDAGGIVAEAGPGVAGMDQGARVYTGGTITGSYAEFTVCKSTQIYPLPPTVSFSQGAAVNTPYVTAYRALFRRAQAQPGETVLIHGASGGVGTAAVQLARAHGLTVIGTAGTGKGRELVRSEGAHHVLDHHSSDYLDKLREITGGRGVDVIIEMLANVNLGKDLTAVARSGRVVIVGSRGNVEINPRDAMSRDAAVLGMTLWNTPEKELAGIHAALVAGLENGTLKPVVGRELPLAEAARAHQLLMEPGAHGKIVLIP
jgi:NADPH2:quinone reductase